MDRFGCVCKVLGLDPENIIDYDRLASDQTEEGKVEYDSRTDQKLHSSCQTQIRISLMFRQELETEYSGELTHIDNEILRLRAEMTGGQSNVL